jgi:hypothetical protein
MIKSLNEISNYELFLSADKNKREIYIFHLSDCMMVGKNIFYPNSLIYDLNEKSIYNPIKEKIMSMEKATNFFPINIPEPKFDAIESRNVFFFVYNTDNYYHFLYDTLPYLITYKYLKSKMDIKLLMNFPNCQRNKFYNFVMESLSLLNINKNDILISNGKTKYKNIYISTSYTHDLDSNLPPRNEIYDLYKEMASRINISSGFPQNIYISRRSWIHNDTTNIGTNYTTKRVMVNETELINYLQSIGYSEIFTEKLSMAEKIIMFKNATNVVGAIGGGLSNVLFSHPNCNLFAICSPGFLSVNKRFNYSLCHTNLKIFNDTIHTEKDEFLKYMRVQYGKIIGEIINIQDDIITISYSDDPVSGWNNDIIYKTIKINRKQCVKLDDGLNSPWSVNINKLKEKIT